MTDINRPQLNCAPIDRRGFGGLLDIEHQSAAQFVAACERSPEPLLEAFYAYGGLLVIPGMQGISDDPRLLVRLSALFGTEVEDYTETLTNSNFFHPKIAEILVLSNNEAVRFSPPARPQLPFTADGTITVQFPHRSGWHTDQSYRRPPPDISLFYGVCCPPPDQAQTLYADATTAYEALPKDTKDRIANLQGIHAIGRTGRSEQAVRRGDEIKPLLPHQASQRQPLVRVHPVTGKRALYLCEDGQMDWLIGPIAGMKPGPDSEAGQLIHSLMTHITQPNFVYVHEWRQGDLLIHDNRSLLHTPTWYDADRYLREMWRTTVMGNPGLEYEGEAKSWIAPERNGAMKGLENLFD